MHKFSPALPLDEFIGGVLEMSVALPSVLSFPLEIPLLACFSVRDTNSLGGTPA